MEKIFEELKKTHKTLFWLDIPESEDEKAKVIFLRKIDRVTYAAGQKLLQKDTLQAAEMMLKSLYVGGDELDPILADFDQLRTAADLLSDVIGTVSGNVRKL